MVLLWNDTFLFLKLSDSNRYKMYRSYDLYSYSWIFDNTHFINILILEKYSITQNR